MPLTCKYLKYSPEITLEIFTLVCNKLIENGINPRKYPIEWHWDRFHVGYPNLLIPDEGEEFSVWGNTQNKRETTVQEILGYDPFVKEKVIPEYVECISIATCNTKIGEIFKCRHINGLFEWEYNNKSIPDYDSWDGWSEKWGSKNSLRCFKPSTKEAFDAQNQPKPFEKWSARSYVVFLKDEIQNNGYKKGEVQRITTHEYGRIDLPNGCGNTISSEEIGIQIKWFATKSEAEKFAKTLVEPVKEEVKQPLKQAVHCKTQEEWDFANDIHQSSLKADFKNFKDKTVLRLDFKNAYADVLWAENTGYQILSFQEWCDLNGYKMEKEVKFEVGQWVYFLGTNKNLVTTYWTISKVCKIDSIAGNILKFKENDNRNTANIDNQFRHATPEEINNHLISIGQIPAGEPLNIGIEPNKDGMFKYKSTLPGTSWSGGTIQNHLDAIIPTTGNSYSKDFSTSIIPVKSISAEVEFNYLPEPK